MLLEGLGLNSIGDTMNKIRFEFELTQEQASSLFDALNEYMVNTQYPIGGEYLSKPEKDALNSHIEYFKTQIYDTILQGQIK